MSEDTPKTVDELIQELLELGNTSSYSGYSAHELGEKLHERGGMTAMFKAHMAVEKKLGASIARSLEAAWDGIGNWRG